MFCLLSGSVVWCLSLILEIFQLLLPFWLKILLNISFAPYFVLILLLKLCQYYNCNFLKVLWHSFLGTFFFSFILGTYADISSNSLFPWYITHLSCMLSTFSISALKLLMIVILSSLSLIIPKSVSYLSLVQKLALSLQTFFLVFSMLFQIFCWNPLGCIRE